MEEMQKVQYRGVGGPGAQILSDPGQTLSPYSTCKDYSSACFCLFVVLSFMEVPLHRRDRLNHWSLVAEFNLQLLFPPRKPGGWVGKCQL